MLWLRRALDETQERRDLARRLRKLERLFPVAAMRQERLDAECIRAYYAECHSAYRKHHSREGATHMALNPDGRFHPDGFAEHLRRIEARWAAAAAPDVLELGFGQGYNLAWLARRHVGVRFHGIDLTPEHLALARQRVQAEGLANVQLQLGDMHALPLPDASVDEVFAIEAFCYADDLPRALGEVMRVLRPGGRFSIFDAYQGQPTVALEPDHALAVELVGRGMALQRWQLLQEVVETATAVGLQTELVQRLAPLVMPNLRRLERTCGAVIRIPWLARRALASRPPERSRNVIAGYLLHRTTSMGLLTYDQVVLRKPGPVDAAVAASAGPAAP